MMGKDGHWTESNDATIKKLITEIDLVGRILYILFSWNNLHNFSLKNLEWPLMQTINKTKITDLKVELPNKFKNEHYVNYPFH